MIRTMVVDDEPLACDALKSLLASNGDVEVVSCAENGVEAWERMVFHQPDLVFLDIHMPECNGMDFLHQLAQNPGVLRPLIIFTTAYENYALEAFEYEALDYLLKPFSDARLAKALKRAKAALARTGSREIGSAKAVQDGEKPLFVKLDHRMIRLEFDDIYWVEAHDHYVAVRGESETWFVRRTMADLERIFPQLLRVHRSFLVNPNFVKLFTQSKPRNANVTMADGKKLPVSRRRCRAVVTKLQMLG